MTPEEFAHTLLEHALGYIAAELPVFPLHSPRKQPRELCDCGAGNDCKSPSKHPRTKSGLTDASLDSGQVRRWWQMWPRANIGIAIPAGFVVLDIDGPEGL